MNPNKALWEKGDFTQIAAFMRDSGEALVRSLNVTPSQNVLDLGCGDGTTAIPLARTGARVTAIDIARNLVEAGNERAAAEGLSRLTFREGDACDLSGVEDDAFDLSISIFGAMFAPKPDDVAREMLRVTKPGGRIVMGNWIPGDPTFASELLTVCSAFMPAPPEGFVSPMMWGVQSHVVERFERAGARTASISVARDTYDFAHASKSATEFMELLESYYGPTMNAVDAARKDGREKELHEQLVALGSARNESKGAGTLIPAAFARVTVLV